MKDPYGNEITGIRQEKLLYEIPNYGQIDRCFNTQAFYLYSLHTDKNQVAGVRFQFDPTEAERFRKNNGLRRL